MIEIQQAHAEKILDLLSHGLVAGLGTQRPGEMCVEAVVCAALGLPHGDDPRCVSLSLRRLKIRLNDQPWSSPMARAEGLKRLALAQLGSLGVLDDAEFRRRVIEMTIRKIVPLALRAAKVGNPKHADALEAAAVRCETEGTRDAAKEGERIARAAYASASASAYASAASAAAYAAAADASASAADAAYASASASASAAYASASASAYASAAYASASASASASADAAADARTRDRVFALYASWVVDILIEMKAPGVQWLHLAPVVAA